MINFHFKEWLQSQLLLEFRSSDFYDFYALELAKPLMQDKEVNDLLIDRGNNVLHQLSFDLGFVLLCRYTNTLTGCAEKNYHSSFPTTYGYNRWKLHKDDFINPGIVNPRLIRLFGNIKNIDRDWNKLTDSNPEAYRIWFKMTTSQQKDAVRIAKRAMMDFQGHCDDQGAIRRSLTQAWESVYNFYMEYTPDSFAPITDSKHVVNAVNKLTQLIHNNGNILEYLPRELDDAIHVRDQANLAQLLHYASPTVQQTLKSANLPSGGLTTQTPPAYPQMLLTAMQRNMTPNIINIRLVSSVHTKDEYNYRAVYHIDATYKIKNNQEERISPVSFSIRSLFGRPTYEFINNYFDPQYVKTPDDPEINWKSADIDWSLPGEEIYLAKSLRNHPISPETHILDNMQAGKKMIEYINNIIKTIRTTVEFKHRYPNDTFPELPIET